MKSVTLTLILAIVTLHIQAREYTIDNQSNLINFSSYCKIGKISVFEISFDGCVACGILESALKAKHYENDRVDIYHYNIDIKNKEVVKLWEECEGVNSFPALYIFGPTKNPVMIYRQGDKKFSLENIDILIKTLIVAAKQFPKNMGNDQVELKQTGSIQIPKFQFKYDSLLKEYTNFKNTSKMLSLNSEKGGSVKKFDALTKNGKHPKKNNNKGSVNSYSNISRIKYDSLSKEYENLLAQQNEPIIHLAHSWHTIALNAKSLISYCYRNNSGDEMVIKYLVTTSVVALSNAQKLHEPNCCSIELKDLFEQFPTLVDPTYLQK